MKLRELLFGRPKSPLDPHVFEKLSLAALLAWVGLGADGLSSSCYGPQEIFEALGHHQAQALAPFLILAVAVTVAVLSAGYANTIEAYPGGGGAYIVATNTLGRYTGLLCGCALIVDYALTIAISMASGIEALLSMLPEHVDVRPYKLPATILVTVGLMLLNLRGIKESIKLLLPIFMGFLVTHALAIGAALFSHSGQIGAKFSDSFTRAGTLSGTMGTGALVLVLIRAYTMGAGTYTGIEALSNSVPILREPRVATAKRTMLYMAVSLALTSGGLLLGYLLYGVGPEGNKTFNAVFLQRLTAEIPLGPWFVNLTLLTEGALLFVAAQAGFVSGPRAVASMAVDSWVPRWFRHLSDRLVIHSGILLVGVGAVLAVWFTGGQMKQLVLIYSFSVFVTFVLSQLGMCVNQVRHRKPGWPFRLSVNAAAFLLSSAVVVSMALFQFGPPILAAAGVISGLMVICFCIRLYYDRVGRLLGRLEPIRIQVESEPARTATPPAVDRSAPTAVVLVRGYSGAGVHTLLTILRTFPNYFRNFVFLSVGDIDFDRFKETHDVERLRESVESDLQKYAALARKWGYGTETRCVLSVDVVEEAVKTCPALAREFPRAIFFAGKLLFEQPSIVTRLLHEQTGDEIQRRLQFEGLTVIMLPIRVMEGSRA